MLRALAGAIAVTYALLGYQPQIQHADAYPTDFRTGLSQSMTDLGGGNTIPGGKVAADVNLLGLNGSAISPANPVPITGTVSSTGATLAIVAGLSASNYDISQSTGAAYSATSMVGGTYIIVGGKFHFAGTAAAAPKTIQLIDVATGAVLLNLVGETRTDFALTGPMFPQGMPGGNQFKVTVSQLTVAGTCTLSFEVDLETAGPLPLTGVGTSPANPMYVSGGFIKDTNNSGFLTGTTWTGGGTWTGTPGAAGSTFTGTSTDISNFAGLTYNLAAVPDQQTTSPALTFEFSVDNSNWDVQVPATINDGSIFIPVPLRPVMQYFRLVMVLGSSANTALRLTTYLHRTVPDQLVRTLSQTPQQGDPATFVRAFVEPSFQGYETLIAADRAMDGSANVLPFIAQDKWQFDVPFANNNIIAVQAGGATATQSPPTGAQLSCANAAGASSAQLLGQKKNRYSPTYEVRASGSMVFPSAGLANARALIGLTDQVVPGSTTQIDPTLGNGIFVGFIGTVFGMHIITGGVVTTIPRSSWNGDLSLRGVATTGSGLLGLSAFRSGGKPIAWDPTKGWALRLRYKYFGVAFIRLEVECPDGYFVVAHTQRGPFGNVPNIQSPNLFQFQEVTKLAGAAAGVLTTQSWSASCGTVAPEIFFEKHEVNGHKQVQQAYAAQTASLLPALSVSPGRQLLIDAINISIVNTGNTNGRIDILDSGTLLHSVEIVAASNQANASVISNAQFRTPLIFLTNLQAVITGGTLTFSLGIAGYEKEV